MVGRGSWQGQVQGNERAVVPLAVACARSALARIRYVDAAGLRTRREVSVLGLGWREDGWFFAGFCQVRGGYTLFRVDRVRSVVVTRKPVPKRETGFDVRAFATADLLDGPPRRLRVRLSGPLAELSSVLFPWALCEPLPGGERLCHLVVSSIDRAALMLASLQPYAALAGPLVSSPWVSSDLGPGLNPPS